MSNIAIDKIDLSHFPKDERFVQIPNKLVLADNLDNDAIETNTNQRTFPVEVEMAVSILCVEGEMDITIDLTRHTLTGNHLALILPNSFVQFGATASKSKLVFMALNPEFLDTLGDVKLCVELGKRLRETPIIQLSREEMEESLYIHKQLKNKLTDDEYGFKQEVAKSYLRLLQCTLFQKMSSDKSLQDSARPANRKQELFIRFVELVKEHYIQHRNISFYADKMCLTPKYLSSIVHEACDSHASNVINQYVILEAKAMLRSEGVTIKEVSHKLNFANQSFFAKFFKQHTGYTPKEYKSL